MFDEVLVSYEDQLTLFEEIAFKQFSELDDDGLIKLEGFVSQPAEDLSVGDLSETRFTLLNETSFAQLKT